MCPKVGTFHSLCVFYGPVHGAEEGTTVLYQAVEVNLLQEVTLGLAEVIGVEPFGETTKDRHRSESPLRFQ